MESMGSLYRAVRERFGDTVELQVVDPRSWPTLLTLLVRDVYRQKVGFGALFRTLLRLPVRGVVVNGRLVARNEWPPKEVVFRAVEEAISA
jgi:hypothetical protein